jgi:membrane-bound lytic murein transglycosylase MltF
LRYLAVVESELRTSATSRVGAKGPWQLMPETAQILGLKVDQDCDERTDYYKSTPAAARYLKDLYAQFGDWLLVLAAYNGGPAPIHHAIRRSGSRNFWVLQRYLPTETRRHVKRFIATHYYFEGHGSVTTLTKAERINYLKTVQHFENSHPVVETKAKKEKTQRPAKPMAAPKKNPAQEGTVAISKPNTEIPANEPGLLKNPAAESENDKFKRIMVNAESAILQSSTVLTPGKQQ